MAYYITNNRAEARAYNTAVTIAHDHNLDDTVKWADIIEHPNGNQFAIQAAAAVQSNMQLVEELDESWTPETELM